MVLCGPFVNPSRVLQEAACGLLQAQRQTFHGEVANLSWQSTTKPKRRLYEVLQSQGLQMNQAITFLSDGDDTLRKLQLEMSPMATHLLDWFHLTMRLTVLDQYGKGLVQCEAGVGEAKRDKIERLKWSLWHGQVDKARGKNDDPEIAIERVSET